MAARDGCNTPAVENLFYTVRKAENSKALNKLLGLYNKKQCDDTELDEFIAQIVTGNNYKI